MWSNHTDRMGSMGGFMGLGWIVILIGIVAVVWQKPNNVSGFVSDLKSAIELVRSLFNGTALLVIGLRARKRN